MINKSQNITILIFFGLMSLNFAVPRHCVAQNKIFPQYYNGLDTPKISDFELLRNRPETVSRKTFCIYPLALSQFNFLDVFTLFSSISFDVNKSLTLSAEAFLGYLQYGPNGDAYPANYVGLGQIGFGTTYYFYNEVITGKINTYVETKQGNSVLARFDGKHRQKLGLKGTVNLLNTTVTNSQLGFIGYDVNDPSMKKVNFGASPFFYNSLYGDPFTNALIGYFSIGPVYERVKDVAVLADNYRKRDISQKYRFYAELLVAPYVKYTNIVFPQTDSFPKKTYNVDKYTPKQMFGFRAGWDFYSLKKIGLTGGVEGGYMPNEGIYYIFKMGVAFNSKRL